jgi:hypothetical protein
MASTKQHLTAAARTLDRMRRDLRRFLADHNMVWLEPRPAPATLPGGEPVTPSRLAARFLAEFDEWRQAVARWERLFGQDRQPPRWRTTQHRCSRFANRIISNEAFQQALVADNVLHRLLGPTERWHQPTVDNAFEAVMSTQHLNHLVLAIETSGLDAGDQSWLFDQQRRNGRTIDARLREFPPSSRPDLEWHLCRYRNAMLQARCLQPDTSTLWPTHFFHQMERTMNLTTILKSNEAFHINLSPDLGAILDILEDLIASLGFDGAWEQLTSDDFESLPGTAGSRQPINIIPSDAGAACASTVVALFRVAAARKPASAFRRVMTDLRTHLLECQSTTQNVVLITDWWNAQVFADEYSAELMAWRRKGVQILVLLVSQPGSMLTPLRVWPSA